MTKFPTASIPDTEVRTIRSSSTHQEYRISVALPATYARQLDKTYPVIYLLDANSLFGMVTEMVRSMSIRVPFCNELPDTLVVGIGYSVDGHLSPNGMNEQVASLRLRDFLPIVDANSEQAMLQMFPALKSVESGGASHFLQFIQQELIPLVEAEYRVDTTNRTLLGHSWGGVFALYTLFQEPRLFQRYVVVGADLPLGKGIILDYEQAFAKQHDALPVRLYLAFAEHELDDYKLPFVTPFVKALESRQYSGFRFTNQTIANCKHCGVVVPAFQAGLASVFE